MLEVKRISASQIKVTWEPGPQRDGSTDYIIVKYYPLDPSMQNLLVQFITTNETELVIQGLDPLLSYSISVAASNAAGMGLYSNDVTVKSKISELKIFVLICQYYFCST